MAAWPNADTEIKALAEMVRTKRYPLSLRETAKIIGVSYTTITRLEHGQAPSFASFIYIARWLGIDVGLT